MIDLNKFKDNYHSQHGEDGILACLFEQLGVDVGTFCEFGAWDGMHLSNTYALYKRGWQGVYIEGDRGRFIDLQNNITSPLVDLVCAFVHPDGDNSLDNLLAKSSIIRKFGKLDLLSIDIDSDDLAVFASTSRFRSSVVVIEYNSTIPLDTEFINPRGKNMGNSPRSIIRVAGDKNYSLVAVTATNLIFVDNDVLPPNIRVFGCEDIEIFTQSRFFFGFDGSLIHLNADSGGTEVFEKEMIPIPWKKAFFVQPVPKIFRMYEQGKLMDALLFIYCIVSLLLTRPISCVRELYRRISSAKA